MAGKGDEDLNPHSIAGAVSALCHLPGPSGNERLVREYLDRKWRANGLDPVRDPVGNLLARVGGVGPRVLLQAHMDEIGFLVRHITEDGFLFLNSAQVGGPYQPQRRFVVGQQALIFGRGGIAARGVFAAPSGHVLAPTAGAEPITLSHLFLDVGATGRAEVEAAGAYVGSPVIWDSTTRLIGTRICGKALDDRVGLAVIGLLLEQLNRANLSCELWIGATVQEENSFHGARAMAAAERFDAVVALDVTLAGDIPVIDSTDVDGRLGAGPVLVHQDRVVAYDGELAWEIADAADAAGVALQHGAYANYGTDGSAFIDAGSPAVALGPATRYTHTANEMLDARDVVSTVELLIAYLTARR